MKKEFNSIVKEIRTSLNFSDLVLPSQTMAGIIEISAAIKDGRQPSISLFYGLTGTGKTLVASLLGKVNGVAVWQVNLASLASKYINETEEKLSLILSEARYIRAILFFDKADALFGKRTGIQDSHDKYANIGASHLLQKLEENSLTAIFSASKKSNLDDAFLRRFTYTVEFPIPNKQERLKLWQQSLNADCKLEPEVNIKEIADKYALTGGLIQNVIRNTALTNSGVFTKAHLTENINAELRNLK